MTDGPPHDTPRLAVDPADYATPGLALEADFLVRVTYDAATDTYTVNGNVRTVEIGPNDGMHAMLRTRLEAHGITPPATP